MTSPGLLCILGVFSHFFFTWHGVGRESTVGGCDFIQRPYDCKGNNLAPEVSLNNLGVHAEFNIGKCGPVQFFLWAGWLILSSVPISKKVTLGVVQRILIDLGILRFGTSI